jgi:hypothetical protein
MYFLILRYLLEMSHQVSVYARNKLLNKPVVSLFGVVKLSGTSNVHILVWLAEQRFITSVGQLVNLRETRWMQLQFIAVAVLL